MTSMRIDKKIESSKQCSEKVLVLFEKYDKAGNILGEIFRIFPQFPKGGRDIISAIEAKREENMEKDKEDIIKKVWGQKYGETLRRREKTRLLREIMETLLVMMEYDGNKEKTP